VTTIFDAAKYIVVQNHEISFLKLQELLYFCQAWCLVWKETSLFPEKIEATDDGIAIPDLFEFGNTQDLLSIESFPQGDIHVLSEAERNVINNVLQCYGKFSHEKLDAMVKNDLPWRSVKENSSPDQPIFGEISKEGMQNFYSNKPPNQENLEEEICYLLNKYDKAFEALS
jgi:uncharacterized phage-associated protein